MYILGPKTPDGGRTRTLATRVSVFTGLLVFWVMVVVIGYDISQDHFNPGKGLFLLGIVVLVAASISHFTSRQLVRPLKILAEGMDAVAKGRLEPITYSRSGDEIEHLARCFNHMTEELSSTQAEVRRQSELLEEKIRQRTESLEEAMQRAMAASRTKTEFLANMSHELRTPMSGFLGMIELVLDSPLSEEQREQLETAQRCGLSLLALLNDVLDLSRIESGKMVMERIPFAPASIAEDSLKSVLPKAQQKGIDLRSDLECQPPILRGDPLRFRQILLNLLSNAVKFTERGSVELRLRGSAGEGGRVVLNLEVADTGTGIPPDKLPLIFEKFTQADGSITRRYGGTGLGLAITRRLVELHSGGIHAESELGKGSTFHVTLEYEAAKEGQIVVPLPALDGNMPVREKAATCVPILVVEDNTVNQKVVAAILRKRGYLVEIASNGQEALDMLARSVYGLVLMDLQMPVMDGLEATQRLRRDPRWRDLPVVAMTAHAMTGDRERCLDAGMNGYISKPVHSAHLLATVEHYVAAEVAKIRRLAPSLVKPKPAPIDPQVVARLMDSDAGLMEGMVTFFLQVASERLHKMHAAASKRLVEVVLHEAHQMRAAAENIAATGVVECITRVEEAAQREELPALKHSLLLLEAEVQRLSRHAASWHDKAERTVAAS